MKHYEKRKTMTLDGNLFIAFKLKNRIKVFTGLNIFPMFWLHFIKKGEIKFCQSPKRCKGCYLTELSTFKINFKDAASSLRQFLSTENPLKMMKNAFYFTLKTLLVFEIFKGNVQFIFLCNPQKSLVNVCLMNILKSTVT